ncbi:MAG TPA: methylated-DNA--[protein]-cysteine S-methyltransferase [Candidatus Dormibacteraeota bacterium]|nr:methylated-DNA--[protein]-cysteine S-methyltransferase [Candidatus Dormibacteraeota bacterium]
MNTVFCTQIASPVGPLLLAGDARGLREIRFVAGRRPQRADPDWQQDAAPFREAIRQLDAYFAAELKDFDLPLLLEGTAFQLSVWRSLRTIPYGGTISYLQLAEKIGNPKAVRAVGLANGSNPIPIIIPCHRVIGSNGSLTGFGGGLPAKQKLLALESNQLLLI